MNARGTAMVLEERRNQHYLRRAGNLAVRRNRRRRSALRWTVVIGAQIALVAALGFAGRQAYLAVITSRHFDVRAVAVAGTVHARPDEIRALAAPAVGMNLFRVDLERMGEEIRRHPWVKGAELRRSLPATIEIRVTEREPAAIASYRGSAWLVDATGRRLGEYGPEHAAFDFPVLTGLETLPRTEAVRRIRQGAAAIGAITLHRPTFARTISEMDLSAPDRLTVRLADGSPLLYLDTDEPLRNLDQYAAIQGRIPSAIQAGEPGNAPKIAYVDLRFRGRIAAMPAGGAEEALP